MTEKITAEEFVKKLYETAGNDLVIRHDPEHRQINLTIRSEGSVGNQFVTDVYSDGTRPSQRATSGAEPADKPFLAAVDRTYGFFSEQLIKILKLDGKNIIKISYEPVSNLWHVTTTDES